VGYLKRWAVSGGFRGSCDALVNQPKPSIGALLLTAAGIPFYFIWRRKSQPPADRPPVPQ
jgi:hypothetical protein